MELIRKEIMITSLEIAERTEKEHKNVMRDIRDMCEELGIGTLKFESSYFTSQNKEMPMYILPKREAMILATGYNVKLRAGIIDRIEVLELRNQNDMLIGQLGNMTVSVKHILPTSEFGSVNKDGIPKTKIIKAHYRSDKNDEAAQMAYKLHKMKSISNGLIDMTLDIEELEQQLAEYERVVLLES